MSTDLLQDVRPAGAAERLLEESWTQRSRRALRHELLSEATSAAAFLAAAGLLAALGTDWHRVSATTCLLLLLVYAVVERTARFPAGTGWLVPSYLAVVPMLLLLPAPLVPLLVGAGVTLGGALQWARGRAGPQNVLLSIPDAWYVLGPAAVLTVGAGANGPARIVVDVGALAAGCLLDLVTSTLREWVISGVAPRLQARVVLSAWTLDACFAPLGFGIGIVARQDLAGLLLIAPLLALLALANRDRTDRIAQAQERLGVLARERARLQAAVQRLGDAFAAQLDLGALGDLLLRSSVEALDAGAGHLAFADLVAPTHLPGADGALDAALAGAIDAACAGGDSAEIRTAAGWAFAIAIPLSGSAPGVLAVARADRPFSADEQQLLTGLAARAGQAAGEIVAHHVLRSQAHTDALTGLGNRRALADALAAALATATAHSPGLFAIFDLDGFKIYNDTHGHPAGDALLVELGRRLSAAVGPGGAAFRLGGDEFCALLAPGCDLDARLADTIAALSDHRGALQVSASCGSVRIGVEALTAEDAIAHADRRMYDDKQRRRPRAPILA